VQNQNHRGNLEIISVNSKRGRPWQLLDVRANPVLALRFTICGLLTTQERHAIKNS
jgi:hypothetical protein